MAKKDEGMDLDDAFADDDDVEYAESKPKKVKKKAEKKVESAGSDEVGEVKIKASKDITELKNGDKIKINGKEYVVDDNVVLIEHNKDTREMALEIFDAKADKDFQLRYFPHNVANSLEFYELQNEFMYVRVRDGLKSVEW